MKSCFAKAALIFSFVSPFYAMDNSPTSAASSTTPAYSADDYQANLSRDEAQFALKLISPDLPHARTILDIGCGTGNNTAQIAQIAPHAQIEGIDIGEGMVAKARALYLDIPNLRFKQADARLLAYDNQFDMAVSFWCIHSIIDKDSLCKSIVRALKPAGLVILSATGKTPDQHPIWDSLLDIAQQKQWQPIAQALHTGNQYYPLEKKSMHNALENAGCVNIDIKEYPLTLTFKNTDALAHWMHSWIGELPALTALNSAERLAFVRALVNRYAQRLGIDPKDLITYDSPQLVIRARKCS